MTEVLGGGGRERLVRQWVVRGASRGGHGRGRTGWGGLDMCIMHQVHTSNGNFTSIKSNGTPTMNNVINGGLVTSLILCQAT
jgi:hypothetical protein